MRKECYGSFAWIAFFFIESSLVTLLEHDQNLAIHSKCLHSVAFFAQLVATELVILEVWIF